MAPHANNLKMLRVVVREDFTRNRCDSLIEDIRSSITSLENMDRETVKAQQDFIHRHCTKSGRVQNSNSKFSVGLSFYHDFEISIHSKALYCANSRLKDEKHSLQGKTGKTHAIC